MADNNTKKQPTQREKNSRTFSNSHITDSQKSAKRQGTGPRGKK